MSSLKVFIVTRIYISASDRKSNGYSDCEVFVHREEACRLFRTWRKDELNIRKETNCEYNILTDDDNKFHCSWDGDREMLVVILSEKIVRYGAEDLKNLFFPNDDSTSSNESRIG